MKADTFAKLLLLQTLVDAEVGRLLEDRAVTPDRFREGLVARVSDLVDEIDALDAVAAARAYDAIVDLLAQMPETDEGIIEAAVTFHRAIDRAIARGMDPAELRLASTWAIVADDLLEELLSDYGAARERGGTSSREVHERAQALMSRIREAAGRVATAAGADADALLSAVDRVAYGVRRRGVDHEALVTLVRAAQRQAARHRASPLTRIGAYVIRQVLTRDRKRRKGEPGGADRRRRAAPASTEAIDEFT